MAVMVSPCYLNSPAKSARALHPFPGSLQSWGATYWEEMDVLRQAIRSSEAAAPPPQDRQGEGEAVRARETAARQAPRIGQEVLEPQKPRSEKSRINKKEGRPWERPSCCGEASRTRQGAAAS